MPTKAMFTRLSATIVLVVCLLSISATSSPTESGRITHRRRQHSNAWGNWQVTVHSPIVDAGKVFETTVNGGWSWQDNTHDTTIGPQQSVGLRLEGTEKRTLFVKVLQLFGAILR
jgi:hypothetical protein